ncbi:MAG: type II toxin-antitoxin system HicB family antitoxin [Deltaproteobacteria bacterium]|nr:type II toxin-antitoxin system HicB family antitoxin [Deltaproteobacteria bacterium]
MDQEQQYTAIVERDRDWYVMHCVELRASGYGPTIEAAKASLTEAILLTLEDQGKKNRRRPQTH